MSQKEEQTLDPAVEKEVQKQLNYLKFGVTEITPEDEFVKMLRHSISTNTPLRVKCGIDPTGADVHLGHLVPYRKMRQFQDLGHVGVVIIGDYTASIGDPSGKNESRPALDPDTIKLNARKYMEQVYTVVDPDKTEVCHQTEWFEEVTLRDVLSWAGQTTAAKLLSHDTFRDRLDKGFSLGLHELFYPVLQGMDSVYVKADVELGGSDQRFNVLMGRDYQKNRGQRPQVAMLLPIITGTCGTQKMSKSLNNYIGILDEPFDKFGKVMSIPDNLMIEWYQYLTDIGEEEFQKLKKNIEDGSYHPNEAKKELASKIVGFFHGEQVGKEMREQFENVFKKKELPDEIQEFSFTEGDMLVSVLETAGVLGSKGEGRRLIKQKAIGIVDGDKIEDTELKLDASFKGKVIKVGKRKFLKLI
ncbi:MAG: tyrosine--tRNA ligase [Deltaproteobacteria bacterium]|nr:MAG: tyrosine--tRNA ligase [Deltaproteobacteria bacterium]